MHFSRGNQIVAPRAQVPVGGADCTLFVWFGFPFCVVSSLAALRAICALTAICTIPASAALSQVRAATAGCCDSIIGETG